MRSTSVRSSARLVMTAATCGICPMPVKVAPPLKSARTKFSVSEVCVTARPSTSVRSSSDLPEPVAPTHRPCGPMPSCAASLRSSMTGAPSSPTPIGTRSRSPAERGRQVRATSIEAASPRFSRSVKSRLASSGSSSSPPPVRSGASCRASASAAGSDSVSGTPSYAIPAPDSRRSRPGRTTTDSPPRGSSSSPATTSTMVTPCSPSAAANAESGGTRPPRELASSTTTRCGWSSTGDTSRLNRGRPSRRGASSASTSARSSLNSRFVPAPSTCPGTCVCGSHFVQSHAGAAPGAATTATTRSSGECSVVSCATSARAAPRADSGSPDTVTW